MKNLVRDLTILDWRASGKWMLLCVTVGVIAGLGGILFQTLGQIVVHSTLAPLSGYVPGESAGEHSLFEGETLPELNVWMIIPIMMAGGLVSGWLVYTFAPEAEGHGTDAAIEAFHQKRGIIRGRIPFIKTVASAVTLGTGGSGGREGPIALIGAAFGSYLGTLLKLSARDRRILLAAGVGAGIGAIFRAPLAGALFAAEILYSESDFEAEVIIPAASASIISYTVYTLWLPAEVRHLPLFGEGLQDYTWRSPVELLLYGVLALVLVIFAVTYIKIFYGTQKLFEKIPVPRAVRPAIGAGLAGLLGVGLFQLWGQNRGALAVLATGYGLLQEALSVAGNVGIPLLLTVAVVKILTTSLTISSGGSGGVFGPSMVIGGCVGSAVGLAFQMRWPDLVPQPGAFGLVGMAGFFAGCAHAPFSTIIMVSEITGGYGLLLPAMWVSMLTFVLCRPWKLYSKQVPTRLESPAHRGDFQIDLLEGIQVRDVFDPYSDVVTLPESLPLFELLKLVSGTRQSLFPVLDKQEKLVGLVTEDVVRVYLTEASTWSVAIASDVMTSRVMSVTPDDDLNVALRCFNENAASEIPVVDTADKTRLLGILRYQRVLSAYNRRVAEVQQDMTETSA